MFKGPFKLLCTASLVTVALAQGFSVLAPINGTVIYQGKNFTIELEKTFSALENITEKKLLIAAYQPPQVDVLYDGKFNSAGVDEFGNEYQDISVVLVDAFEGPGTLYFKRSYLEGLDSTTRYTDVNMPVIFSSEKGQDERQV